MLVMLVPYSVILMAAGYLLRTVSEEKTNRTMEMLLVSLDPRKMLAGKLMAWGLLGLLQAVLLAGFGYVLFFSTGQMTLPAGLTMTPSFLAWIVVLSLLGYAVYASLMAGAGALMPNWREARGPTFILSMPALLGFYVALIAINQPNGLPMVLVSLFPLTAPFTMAARLVRTAVPLWQLLLACALMVLTTWVVTRSVATMFNAQNLLTGQPFSVKRYLRALSGRG
jgi:ABC-2 type transport system permease protein